MSSQHSAAKYLYDMLDCCRAIKLYTNNRNLQDLHSDRMLRKAMEREFEIVGEALSKLSKLHPEVEQRIPDWRLIIGFRNRLAHDYDGIDLQAVWAIVEEKLDDLIGVADHHALGARLYRSGCRSQGGAGRRSI